MNHNEYNVVWTKLAEKDLDDIIEYISEDSVDTVIKILSDVKKKTNELYKFPDRGRIVPELKVHNITNYREIIYSVWKIMYKIDENKVYVMIVIDGRRNIEDILLNRLLRDK